MHELLDRFVESTKRSQLLIVQPSMVAMIYAINAKPGCYTGFCQTRTPTHKFDYMDFISMQALPGPGSIVTCILQPYSKSGPTHYMTIEKSSSLS